MYVLSHVYAVFNSGAITPGALLCASSQPLPNAPFQQVSCHRKPTPRSNVSPCLQNGPLHLLCPSAVQPKRALHRGVKPVKSVPVAPCVMAVTCRKGLLCNLARRLLQFSGREHTVPPSLPHLRFGERSFGQEQEGVTLYFLECVVTAKWHPKYAWNIPEQEIDQLAAL